MINGQTAREHLEKNPLAVPPGCTAIPLNEDGTATAPKIECIPVMAKDVADANVEKTRARGHMNFLQLPEVGRPKSTPIAIVAGGPSARNHIEKIRTYRTVMTVSTMHDYVIERGIYPRYHVMFDPCAHANGQENLGSNMGYFNRACDTCTYIISSHSEPAIFDAFNNLPVVIWHAAGDISDATIKSEGAITGGCTAALRAIVMAIVMGYWDIHVFGLDSCYLEGDSHSYPQNEPLSQRYNVKIEGSDRTFDTTTAWIAQAQQFFDFLKVNGGRFRPTVYGNGLISEMFKVATRTNGIIQVAPAKE